MPVHHWMLTPSAWLQLTLLCTCTHTRHPPAFTACPCPAPVQATDDALDLLSRMMAFDASRRISAADALQHRYFRADPPPSAPDQLPKPHRQLDEQQPPGQPPQASENGRGGGGHEGDAGQDTSAPGGPAPGQPGDSAGPSGQAAAVQQQHQHQGATPAWDVHTSALPEGHGGELERPKLGTEDITFLRKRKLALDEAFEEQASGS